MLILTGHDFWTNMVILEGIRVDLLSLPLHKREDLIIQIQIKLDVKKKKSWAGEGEIFSLYAYVALDF